MKKIILLMNVLIIILLASCNHINTKHYVKIVDGNPSDDEKTMQLFYDETHNAIVSSICIEKIVRGVSSRCYIEYDGTKYKYSDGKNDYYYDFLFLSERGINIEYNYYVVGLDYYLSNDEEIGIDDLYSKIIYNSYYHDYDISKDGIVIYHSYKTFNLAFNKSVINKVLFKTDEFRRYDINDYMSNSIIKIINGFDWKKSDNNIIYEQNDCDLILYMTRTVVLNKDDMLVTEESLLYQTIDLVYKFNFDDEIVVMEYNTDNNYSNVYATLTQESIETIKNEAVVVTTKYQNQLNISHGEYIGFIGNKEVIIKTTDGQNAIIKCGNKEEGGFCYIISNSKDENGLYTFELKISVNDSTYYVFSIKDCDKGIYYIDEKSAPSEGFTNILTESVYLKWNGWPL